MMQNVPKPARGPWGDGYGWRTLPDGSRNFHNGRDLQWLNVDPAGSQKVYAPVSGRVIVDDNALIGNFVSLPLGDGWSTRLCHFAEVAVVNAQHVERGQYLGRMGATGSQAFGVHLHIDVFDPAGRRHDPSLFYSDTFVGALAPASGPPTLIPKASDPMSFIASRNGTAWLVTPGANGALERTVLGAQDVMQGFPTIDFKWDTSWNQFLEACKPSPTPPASIDAAAIVAAIQQLPEAMRQELARSLAS
jgi:hypothetical protein